MVVDVDADPIATPGPSGPSDPLDPPVPSDPEGPPAPPPPPTRALAVAIAIVLLVGIGSVVLGVNGGGGSVSSALKDLRRAPEAAREAGTARFDTAFQIEAGGGGTTGFSGSGSTDLRVGSGTYVYTLFGRTLEFRSPDGQDVFVAVPEELQKRSEGRPWLRYDATALGGSSAPAARGLRFVEVLAGAVGDVTEVGVEDVNGVRATRYRVDVDVGVALEAASPAARPALEQLGAIGDEAFPLDAWLTEGGLPVRVAVDTELSGVRVQGTTELSEYGSAVQVQVPRPAETYTGDPALLLASLLSGA